MDQKPVLNYPSQLALLLGLTGVAMILGGLLMGFAGSAMMHVPVKDFTKTILLPENVNLSRILNTLTGFLVFCLPSYVLSRVMSKKPFAQMGFSSAISFKQIVLVLIIMLASIFLGDTLKQLNERIPIPADWQTWANQLEADYKTSILSMARMNSLSEYFIGLVVLAFFPALFEEILFRGALQRIMVGWTNNKWFGIIITAVLFSAIHISYFGFLPRVALGVVLGLVFYHSKNLWLCVIMHFANNALVVTQLYVLTKQGKTIEQASDENLPMWWGLIGIALLVVVFRVFKKESALVLIKKELQVHSSPENILS